MKAPYTYDIGNRQGKAHNHFYALREAKPDLVGFCLLDRITRQLQQVPGLITYAWQRREIENYVVFNKQILIDWARVEAIGPADDSLFSKHCVSTMEETIVEIEKARATLRQESPWSLNIKVTDDFLDPLFETFFEKLKMTNFMRKTNYYTLVQYLPKDQIDPEVTEVLDAILEVANRAVPLSNM